MKSLLKYVGMWLLLGLAALDAAPLFAQGGGGGQEESQKETAKDPCNWLVVGTFYSIAPGDPTLGDKEPLANLKQRITFNAATAKGVPVMLYFRSANLANFETDPAFVNNKEMIALSKEACCFVLIDPNFFKELVRYNDVKTLPTLIFAAPEGYEYKRLTGAFGAKDVTKAVGMYADWRDKEEKRLAKLMEKYQKDAEAAHTKAACADLVKIIDSGYLAWPVVASAQDSLNTLLKDGLSQIKDTYAKATADTAKASSDALKELASTYADTAAAALAKEYIKKIEAGEFAPAAKKTE